MRLTLEKMADYLKWMNDKGFVMLDVKPTDTSIVRYYETIDDHTDFEYCWRVLRTELKEIVYYMTENLYSEVEITKSNTTFFTANKENKLDFTPGAFIIGK